MRWIILKGYILQQKQSQNPNFVKNFLEKMDWKQIKNENGTIREIAKKYGIGKTQVGYIKQGKRWQK